MKNSIESQHVIWILCSNRWHSALAEYALCTLKALINKEFKCAFSALLNKSIHNQTQVLTEYNYPFCSFGISELIKFNKYFKHINPDTIIVFEGKESFLSKFIYFYKKKAVQIIRFFGSSHDIEKLNNKFKIKLALSHINKIIVPSNLVKSKLISSLNINIPIKTIYLGRNENIFNRKSDNIKKLSNKDIFNASARPIFTVIGRFDPIKGYEHVIKLMSLILKKWNLNFPKPKLQIIGQEANLKEKDIIQLIGRYNLKINEDVILITEKLNNINEYIINSTLGLIPSLGSEIICRVAQEFLMCGVPIIVSGVGSLEEMIFDSTAGASYRSLNDQECVDLILKWAYQSIMESEQIKLQRSLKALQLYSLEIMGEQLKKFILSK